MPDSAEGTGPKKRATQSRSDITRTSLLETATLEFAMLGYEGVSVRALETKAGVQRGAVAYHFNSKENLWKQVAQGIFEKFDKHLDPLRSVLPDLDRNAQITALMSAFVRFNAEKPQLNRIIIQEGRIASWRLDYLMDHLIRGRLEQLSFVLPLLEDPHAYYMAVGAATLVFDVEEECRSLFRVDPTSDAFVQEHARRISQMVIALTAEYAAEA